jgi:hypothetical protein
VVTSGVTVAFDTAALLLGRSSSHVLSANLVLEGGVASIVPSFLLFSPSASSTSSASSIQSRLKKISYNSQLYKSDSGVFDQISNEVSEGLKIDSQYRFDILRGIQSFNHVSDEDIHVLVQLLEEIYFNNGDYIIYDFSIFNLLFN